MDAPPAAPVSAGPARALRAVGGLVTLIGLGFSLAAGWGALHDEAPSPIAAPPAWWPAPAAALATSFAWLPARGARAPVEAGAAALTLGLALAGLAAGASVAGPLISAAGALALMLASTPRRAAPWARPDGLSVLGAVLALLTGATLAMELGRATTRWVDAQRVGARAPATPRFTDGRGLPQAEPSGLELRWLPGAEEVQLPSRSRPAPIEDGEAAIGPTRALANVVLIVDLADPGAPAWLDLIDAVQDARRGVARIVVKVAPDGDCTGADSCAWARLHYCAAEQGRAWDLLDLRSSDPEMRAPPTGLAARLGLNPDQLTSCLGSRPARLGALRAGAAVRVMRREGLPWLDVEGFGWTATPPLAGDVISVIDSVIAAYKGAEEVRPTRLTPAWSGPTAPPPGLSAARPPASATEAAAACAREGAALCGLDALNAVCQGAAAGSGRTPRRSAATRFRLADPCARPGDCAALDSAAPIGVGPAWAQLDGRPTAVGPGGWCVAPVDAPAEALPFLCCSTPSAAQATATRPAAAGAPSVTAP